MLEILLEKFHDIDAKNSLAGDTIFHIVAQNQAHNIILYLEDGHGVKPRQQDPRAYTTDLCLNTKTTKMPTKGLLQSLLILFVQTL
jgi:hypothetical protein